MNRRDVHRALSQAEDLTQRRFRAPDGSEAKEFGPCLDAWLDSGSLQENIVRGFEQGGVDGRLSSVFKGPLPDAYA